MTAKKKITRQEVERARLKIHAAGKTIKDVGRKELARLLKTQIERARTILRMLRGDVPIPEEPQETIRRQDREIKSLRGQVRSMESELRSRTAFRDFLGRVAAAKVTVSQWTPKTTSGKIHPVIPTAFLSDTHFDEVVKPDQIDGLNEYNRRVAEKRLSNFFLSTLELCQEYLHGFRFPEIVVPLGGDLFSGEIHEELLITNESAVLESLLYWLGPMASGIRLFAENFPVVRVPVVAGNHPRNTKKPQAKDYVFRNYDWVFAKMLEREVRAARWGRNVSFQIGAGVDVRYSIYNTRYCLTHGDQFRGGSGISAELAPLFIGDARKRKRAVAAGNPYDYLLMGHWHRLRKLEGIIVNGSLKGYDEYSYRENFPYEVPRQAFWLTDPKHGVTIFAPIHVMDKSEPGYQKMARAAHRFLGGPKLRRAW